jgi:hypothetical protein
MIEDRDGRFVRERANALLADPGGVPAEEVHAALSLCAGRLLALQARLTSAERAAPHDLGTQRLRAECAELRRTLAGLRARLG